MSDRERGDIMDALRDLPEADKQFMLGYAAGRAAAEPVAKSEQTDSMKENQHNQITG